MKELDEAKGRLAVLLDDYYLNQSGSDPEERAPLAQEAIDQILSLKGEGWHIEIVVDDAWARGNFTKTDDTSSLPLDYSKPHWGLK